MDLDNVNKPFIWRKKYEELGIKMTDKEMEAEARRRAEENRVELEKIRERQRLRDIEYQQRLSDGEFLSRQREAEHHEHWEQQEDDFVLRQHRKRSKIRIRDGRAKCIDLLAHYIDIFGPKPDQDRKSGCLQDELIDLSESPVELLNPCDWFNGLRQSDLEELKGSIEVYMHADCEENRQYWGDLLEITLNELEKLKLVKEQSKTASNSEVNSAIVSQIMSLFEGKSISELDDLEDEMNDCLASDDPSVDKSFYRNAISRLRAYRAKTRLTQAHKSNLKRQKSKILDLPADKKPELTSSLLEKSDEKATPTRGLDEEDDGKSDGNQSEDDDYDMVEDNPKGDDKFERTRSKCIEDYKAGNYSPKMLRKSQLEPGTILVEYHKEYEALVHYRNQVCNGNFLDESRQATMSREERAFMDTASKGMNNQEESVFSCEAAVRGVDNKLMTYAWADKYHPRKPRYFNRVHTGFEWNKYNQTHYDIDNPPPKVVQGYKFNIFYPDLIDKSKAPTFSVTPCKDDKDFCTIRFSAGPPYEDIAFRIVNREWNSSHKSGYRCQFTNNMLQLWFQFKRYRYRR